MTPRRAKIGRSSVLSRFEPVADIADGVDEGGVVRVGLDFGAQGGDAAVDAAGRHHDGAAPDHVQNLVAGKRASLARHQVLEQPELLRGQLELVTLAEEFVRGQIQLIAAKFCSYRMRPSRAARVTTWPLMVDQSATSSGVYQRTSIGTRIPQSA